MPDDDWDPTAIREVKIYALDAAIRSFQRTPTGVQAQLGLSCDDRIMARAHLFEAYLRGDQ